MFHLLVLGLAVYLAVIGRISYGTIFTFSMLFMSVMTPLAEVHRILDEGHEASLRIADLMDLLALPIDPSFDAARAEPREEEKGQPVIEAHGVGVEYARPCGTKSTVLCDVSLEIFPGETLGIVGRTGCGKSTLLKAFMRLVHPCRGKILLRGVPLDQLSREAISRLIAYVGQFPFMFAGTIADNITYGCLGSFQLEQIHEAAQRACIHEEIMQMPEGYDSLVAERGQNLSGGQRQRLALARVFLQDAPLLILDEATSALDNIIERRVQRSIEEAREDKTVILVAHRLSTLTDADRILVFDKGRVAESGSYDELIRQGGIFSEMVVSGGKHEGNGHSGPKQVAVAV